MMWGKSLIYGEIYEVFVRLWNRTSEPNHHKMILMNHRIQAIGMLHCLPHSWQKATFRIWLAVID